MFSALWHNLFFDPVYNALVFFIDTLPGGDVGLAIVLTTVLVKVLLLPFSLRAARTQLRMREIEPEMKKIKEKFKDKRDEQARRMMELYRNAGVNPFSSILLLFIQIPIIIALYFSVSPIGAEPHLPEINTALLYSFVPSPEVVSMLFLGFVDIAARSLPLAAAAGITQFFHTRLSLPKPEKRDPNKEPNFKDDLTRNMQLQMRYTMPLIIFFVAYGISAAIALYFFVSNVVAIMQELVVRKKGYRSQPSEEKKD